MINKKKIVLSIRYILLLIFSFITIYPFSLLVNVSLKTKAEFLKKPLALALNPQFNNYLKVFVESNVLRAFSNSFIITAGAVAFQLLLGAMVGYALTKTRFKKAKLWSAIFLLPMVFPIQSIMIPLYIILNKLHLLNSLLALIYIYAATSIALVIFIMTSFMSSIPYEMSEAAIVDGASHNKIFLKIILPLMKPVVSTVVIISGLSIWNDFFLPLIVISKASKKTLPLIIYSFMGQYSNDWNLIATCIVYVISPIIVIYLILQKRIIQGVISGAVKG